MYYKLHCETPEDEEGGYAEIRCPNVPGVDSWITGRPLGVKLEDAIVCKVKPEDSYTGPIVEMYQGKIFLMSERLVEAVRSAGVENIDCYPALLVNTDTGKKHPYFAVNIVGVVAAADLGASQWENFDGEAKIDTFFDKLVIDNGKCYDLLMFRLAESLSTVIVHERVRECILARGISTMTFLSTQK